MVKTREKYPVMRVTFTGIKQDELITEQKPITRYIYAVPTVTSQELREFGSIIELLGTELKVEKIMKTQQTFV